MKVFKRNAVILTVIVFVCAAVYLNWAYSRGKVSPTPTPSAQTGTVDEASGLYYEGGIVNVSDYFSAVRLDRQQARDAAMSVLNNAIETMSMSQEVMDSTAAEIAAITEISLNESEIESMIKAKGFDECVVFLKDDSVMVAVSAPVEGLSEVSVAQIADIILQETEMTLDQIRVVEVKG